MIPFKPELFLLNIIPDIQGENKKHLVIHVNAAVRLSFAQLWKNEEVPKLEILIEKIYEVAEMDISSERMKDGNIGKISAHWKSFYEWLDK